MARTLRSARSLRDVIQVVEDLQAPLGDLSSNASRLMEKFFGQKVRAAKDVERRADDLNRLLDGFLDTLNDFS